MSGSLPTSPGFSEAGLTHNQPVIVSNAQTGKRKSRIIAGHLWEITASYPPMTRMEFSPIYSFIISQRGAFDSFTLTLPNFNTPQGTQSGALSVNGIHSAGDSSIQIDGMLTSETEAMKAGDILKFANHTKVYMLTADVDTDGGGAGTFNIEPPLINDLVDNELVTIENVPFTVASKGGPQEFKTRAPGISRFSIDLIEDIN